MVSTISAHALRNPGKQVQLTRKRTSGLSTAAKATKGLKTAQRKQRQILLEDDVDVFYAYRASEITRLAKLHARTERAIRNMICNTTQYKAQRAPNLRNAIIHDMCMKRKEAGTPRLCLHLDEGNSPLLMPGKRTKALKFLQEDLQDDIDDGAIEVRTADMDEAEKIRLIQQLVVRRELKRRGTRATSKAAATDGRQTANRVGDEVRRMLSSLLPILTSW